MDLFSLHRAHVQQLSQRAAAVLERSGFSAIAVHSGTPLKRTREDDQFWPLRVTPHFQHWLPLAEPGCLLIVAPGRRPVLVRPAVASFWEATPPSETDHFLGGNSSTLTISSRETRCHSPRLFLQLWMNCSGQMFIFSMTLPSCSMPNFKG